MSFSEVSRLMTEGRAISVVCEAIAGRENPLKAQRFVEGLLVEQPTETVEDLVTWYAMNRISGREIHPTGPLFYEEGADPDRELFLATSDAWVIWATEGPTSRVLPLHSLNTSEEGSSITHHIALTAWAQAVKNLLAGDLAESKRFYRRAIEVGGQFGTETNSVIVWTYAATFFHPSHG
jgi:hypothetical protein